MARYATEYQRGARSYQATAPKYDHWTTSPRLAVNIEGFFDGPTDFDPFPAQGSRHAVKAKQYIRASTETPWPDGKALYAFPPPSQTLAMCELVLKWAAADTSREVLVLTRFSPGSKLWRGPFGAMPAIMVPKIPLILDDTGVARLDMGSDIPICLAYFGPDFRRFFDNFSALGVVWAQIECSDDMEPILPVL